MIFHVVMTALLCKGQQRRECWKEIRKGEDSLSDPLFKDTCSHMNLPSKTRS